MMAAGGKTHRPHSGSRCQLDRGMPAGPSAGQCRHADQTRHQPSVSRQICQQWPVVGLPTKCRPHADQIQHRLDSEPTGIQTVGRRRISDLLLTTYRRKPTSGRHRADCHFDSEPMSGCRLTADHMPMKTGIGLTVLLQQLFHKVYNQSGWNLVCC